MAQTAQPGVDLGAGDIGDVFLKIPCEPPQFATKLRQTRPAQIVPGLGFEAFGNQSFDASCWSVWIGVCPVQPCGVHERALAQELPGGDELLYRQMQRDAQGLEFGGGQKILLTVGPSKLQGEGVSLIETGSDDPGFGCRLRERVAGAADPFAALVIGEGLRIVTPGLAPVDFDGYKPRLMMTECGRCDGKSAFILSGICQENSQPRQKQTAVEARQVTD